MKKINFLVVFMAMAATMAWADYSEGENLVPKSYDDAKVVRIKQVEGEAYVLRSYEEGNEEATANLPIFENDQVGTTDGRLEIYLGRLNYLRLDSDSIVRLEKIPELRHTDLTLKIEKGGIYLDVENLDNEREIEIQTPDCGVFLLNRGLYRINVISQERTEVLVLDGIAEVAGRESSWNVRESQKMVMQQGEMQERPYYFYASEKDDFDLWNEKRDDEIGYARFHNSRYLEEGYEDCEYELSRNGRWVFMDAYRCYTWIPYIIETNWRPYYCGRWVWNPYYGYLWVSYDSWGWYTHHYGRWQWDPYYGWYWIPGYHWAPAWVSWFWDDYYYGWSPLNWWNWPVVIINNIFHPHYDFRHGYPIHSRSTIIIRKNQLQAAAINKVALRETDLRQIAQKDLALKSLFPTERSPITKISVVDARGKTVTYKQDALLSPQKFQGRSEKDLHQLPLSVQEKVSRYTSETQVSRRTENNKPVRFMPDVNKPNDSGYQPINKRDDNSNKGTNLPSKVDKRSTPEISRPKATPPTPAPAPSATEVKKKDKDDDGQSYISNSGNSYQGKYSSAKNFSTYSNNNSPRENSSTSRSQEYYGERSTSRNTQPTEKRYSPSLPQPTERYNRSEEPVNYRARAPERPATFSNYGSESRATPQHYSPPPANTGSGYSRSSAPSRPVHSAPSPSTSTSTSATAVHKKKD